MIKKFNFSIAVDGSSASGKSTGSKYILNFLILIFYHQENFIDIWLIKLLKININITINLLKKYQNQ